MSKKPFYIFIGEEHRDFSNVSLVHQLLQSCKDKGLKASFCPEHDSQVGKIEGFLANATNLPENWREIASKVDESRDKEFHLLGNRAETVFDPFFAPIAGVPSNGGRFTGATAAFSEVIRKITDPTAEGFIGINKAFLPEVQRQINRAEERCGDINAPENFGKYVCNVTPNLLLSSAIANHMAEEIQKHQTEIDADVVIVLTGFLHSENVAAKLGIPKNEMNMVANCENQFIDLGYLSGIDVTRFDVDASTNTAIIPQLIEGQLTKRGDAMAREPEIGGHANSFESAAIGQSWTSKVAASRELDGQSTNKPRQ